MKKVLIVDDEASIRSLVRECIQTDGYELREAENGTEALKVAREFKPDLVILDLMMPDMWGYDVCAEIKKDPETSRAIVLFLTARSSRPSQKMGDLSGGDDYIVKPFNPLELREKVLKLLKADR